MIIDDTYDCTMLTEDEDDNWFETKSRITLHDILYINEVYLNSYYSKVTEVFYKSGHFIYIKEPFYSFELSWKKFKRSVNLYSIN